MTARELMQEAEQARKHSYSPYSRFPVGAALLTSDGQVIHGTNVENASFGLSVCAERTAVWKAVGQGLRDFEAIAVTARDGSGAPPCGACRQILYEFSPDMWVYWRDSDGRILRKRLAALLANAFDMRQLRRKVPTRHR